jgi:hypothetical protein
MLYLVTNIKGSSDIAPHPKGYSSWLDYWECQSGQKVNLCKRIYCNDKATDGAHVQVEGYGNYWYIVPLCHADNMSPIPFVVTGPLVPINDKLPILL